jgi:hypothetical protein
MIDFEKYFKSLQSQRISEITEHTHRGHLQQLLESLSGSSIKILHEPKREGRFGAPDFKITQSESIIGYIENKKIEENLDKILKSNQIKKYQSLSDNILITNYIDWIWIKNGEVQQRENLCFLTDIENKRKKLDTTKAEAVRKLIQSFFSQAPKEIADTKKLANALAVRAKLLKDFLFEELLRQEKEHQEGRLFQLFETFKNFVFQELSIEDFADAFAQNLAYGLFLAKLNADTQLVNLYNAKKFIPTSFELIRELVNFLDELDNEEYKETKWLVEEILTIMNHLDLNAIHQSLSFNQKRKDIDNIPIKDPYVYFYEDFLAEYDTKLRKSKGVYYTPPPVVNFIVRAIDDILVDTFGIKDGLADRNKVTVLDFATGTGTFLVEILQQIFEKLPKDSGRKELLIKEHILKNIFGFEYLIAPYTIAHLKLSQFLKDNEYELKSKERLQVYLTNTLEPIPAQIKIPLLPALTEESKQAQRVKDKPILVITGNPPYSIHSKNNNEWIKNKIEDYKIVDDKKFKERNPKGLQDDYVKFIRFAQDKMDAVEEGIVGIITNHSFLDNPTFRGMRQSLMKTFNQIFVIDLHGNSYKQESNPNGERDENVFDIKAGVAISILIKKKNIPSSIFHSEFWGMRKSKYTQCLNNSLKTIHLKSLQPSKPLYVFKPQNEDLKELYYSFYGLKDIFYKSSSGVKTHRDHFAIAFERSELEKRLSDFRNLNYSDNQIAETYKLKDTRDWKLTSSRISLSKNDDFKREFIEYLYRPFDVRVTYFSKDIIELPRKEIMQNFDGENVALVSTRLNRQLSNNYFFVSNLICDVHLLDTADSVLISPLYIYSSDKKEINFSSKFREQFKDLLDIFSEEQVFSYIYAILQSPSYQTKYAEFLKFDFPRIPFTKDKKLFQQLSDLGKELIHVHLLKLENINALSIEFMGKGNSEVEKIVFVEEEKIGKLYVNKNQYFSNIPKNVYEFYVGGYQVLDKFLKDRKGRKFGLEDVDLIVKIIHSIDFTIKQIQKIDSLTKHWI